MAGQRELNLQNKSTSVVTTKLTPVLKKKNMAW